MGLQYVSLGGYINPIENIDYQAFRPAEWPGLEIRTGKLYL